MREPVRRTRAEHEETDGEDDDVEAKLQLLAETSEVAGRSVSERGKPYGPALVEREPARGPEDGAVASQQPSRVGQTDPKKLRRQRLATSDAIARVKSGREEREEVAEGRDDLAEDLDCQWRFQRDRRTKARAQMNAMTPIQTPQPITLFEWA